MVSEDGVYKLTYSFLQHLGVDVGSLASDQINIYGNHAGLLPFQNSPAEPNDLVLNAIDVEDGGDGQFGPSDYILFYASSAQSWNLNTVTQRFNHTKNVYSDSADYFIGIGVDPPRRIIAASLSSDPATEQVTGFSDRQFIDRDLVNIQKTGRTWYAETYDITTTYNYNFDVPFLQSTKQTCLTMNVLSRTLNSGTSTFHVSAGPYTHDIVVGSVPDNPDGAYGKDSLVVMCFLTSGNSVPITVTFEKHDPATSIGHMNWLELNAPRDLKMVGNQLGFRDPASVGVGKISEFTVDLATNVHHIWEITDPTDVRDVAYTDNGAQKIFRVATDSLRQFIAFTNTNFPEPTPIGPVPNQDLHSTPLPTDLVIVCPPEFQGEAQRLADRRASEGLSVMMVSPQQVFNEFSSGQRDATAIKRYMKMLYDRAGMDEALIPRYLLLFGDGSYNNISLTPSNQNYIPTYQTSNSYEPAKSYTSDDYFGLLDDSEGESTADLVDIGVGRLPISDATQARN